MQIYDKVILDASNFFYRVAAFYLKNLSEQDAALYIKNNTIFNNYRQTVLNLANQTMGTLYILFDPLRSDGQKSERQKLLETYKGTRVKNDAVSELKMDTLQKLYSHFILNESKKIKVLHSLEYEADDYAEKLTEEGKCLLITSDEDFTRYLVKDRVEMLIQGISIKDDGVFTFDDFVKKHEFKPSISSVTFWKVFWGDKSDNIPGIFLDSRTKILRSANDLAKELVKEMGEENVNYFEEKRNFFSGTGRFAKLKELLELSNTSKSYKKLLDLADENFQIIESRLPRESDISIEKFITKVDVTVKSIKKSKFTLNGVKK